MDAKKSLWGIVILLIISLFITPEINVTAVAAQDEPDALQPHLFITTANADSLPAIEVQAYGYDGDGLPLTLSGQTVTIEHNGTAVDTIENSGKNQVGTFTIFLIDIPSGVSGELAALQEAILQYTNTPHMVEQVDAVAIYQIGETGPKELLGSESFYNSIRNLFAEPLTPETGTTALIDSTYDLLGQITLLKPRPEMATSLVVMTDGTDVVSRRDYADVADLAAEMGVPLHTIWLDNADLTETSKNAGQGYLTSWAASTGGIAKRLDDSAGVVTIWERIATFRDQDVLRYTIDALRGGEALIKMTLIDGPAITAETSVTIPNNAPSIAINLPPESRLITVPDLDDPITMRLSTDLSWMDGEERSIEAAQLVVNGVPQEIPADSVTDFTVDVQNLAFGNNRLRVAILDDQGMKTTSPEIILTVNEGRTELPEEVQPTSVLASIGTILLWLVIFVVIGMAVYFIWQKGWLNNLRLPKRRKRGPQVQISDSEPKPSSPPTAVTDEWEPVPTDPTPPPPTDTPPYPPPGVIAFLDVLESLSSIPTEYALHGDTIRIGRSPSQADIPFEQDLTVSRLHISLVLEDAGYRVFDEQSTSGTWVNEQPVPEYGILLNDGDEIHLGTVHLRFRLP